MVKRYQKIDLYKSIFFGVVIDMILLFGVYPAFGYPEPQLWHLPFIILIDQLIGFSIMWLAKQDGKSLAKLVRR